MITLYHLGVSQSDRIVWLLEELELPYRLEWFDRQESGLAPPEYKALHPVATAPTIRDGDTVMCESVAIIEYIINRHGGGRLAVSPEQSNYPDYLYWLHVGSALMSAMGAVLMARMVAPEVSEGNIYFKANLDRQARYLAHMEQRLGESDYLAGPELTGADIMNMFALTTMPVFGGPSTEGYPNIRRYVAHISQRPAYQKAMSIAGPEAKRPG